MTNNQKFGACFGVFFVAMGALGLAATWGIDTQVLDAKRSVLFGFNPCFLALNPIHSLIHIGGGALLLVGATKPDPVCASFNRVGAVIYLAFGVVGVLLVAVGVDAVVMHGGYLHLTIGATALAFSHAAVRTSAHPIA